MSDLVSLVDDPSVDGPNMAFGNNGTFAPGRPDVGTAGSNWFVMQWNQPQPLTPGDMVAHDTLVSDPTYGTPAFSFLSPDNAAELDVYNSGGAWLYGLRESGGLFNGAGANVLMQTMVGAQAAPYATFNHQISLSLDAKLTDADVAPLPGQDGSRLSVIVSLGFIVYFNAPGSADYTSALPTIQVMFQLPVTQTANVAAYLYPQFYGVQLGLNAPLYQNVAGEVIDGEQQLALAPDGGPLHPLSYDLNTYLDAMLEQSVYIDPATGKPAPLPASYTDLARWSVSGVYLGPETANRFAGGSGTGTVQGSAAVGFLFGNFTLTADPSTDLTYAPPPIQGHQPTVIQPAAGPTPTPLSNEGAAVPTPFITQTDGYGDAAGTGVPGDVVVLFAGATSLGSATVDTSQGTWSVTASPTLSAPGTYVLTAVQYDLQGDASTPSDGADVIVLPGQGSTQGGGSTSGGGAPTVPAPVITTSATSGPVTGSGVAGDTVVLFDGAASLGAGTVDAQDVWTVTPSPTLAAGAYLLTARQYDAQGDASSVSAAANVIVANGTTTTQPEGGVTVAGSTTVLAVGQVPQYLGPSTTPPLFIQGGTQSETILGGTGLIQYQNGGAADSFVGGTGSATINTGTGGGIYFTGQQPSSVVGGTGAATVSAAGVGTADTIFGGGPSLYFTNGSDALFVTESLPGTPTLVGGSGADTVFGGVGPGVYFLGSTRSEFAASTGAATVVGTGQLYGGAGSTELVAAAANATLIGGAGPTLMFGADATTFVGGSGSATLAGGSGSAVVFTGAGRLDAFLGTGQTSAVLQDGSGALVTGGGADTFWLTAGQAGGNYTLYDFRPAQDRLVLNNYAPGVLSAAEGSPIQAAGSSTLALPDGTRITFAGLATLPIGAILGPG